MANDGISTRSQLASYLAADLAALNVPRWQWRTRFTHPVAHFQRLLRTVEYHDRAQSPAHAVAAFYLKLRLAQKGRKLGFTIPRGVFGPGLALVHIGTVVVTPRARVGRDCRVHQNVTIGQWRGEGPKIGDRVFLGPGAQVVGNITVGDDVMIAGNAVVVDDVPSNVLVGGIPARIIGPNPGWG